MKTKIAIACGLVLMVVAIAVFIASQPSSQPGGQSDFAPLIPVRAPIPASSNGYALLLEAAEQLSLSNNEPILANYTNWNEPAAREILARNRSALADLHQAWALPCLQVEAVTNFAQQFDYLTDWRHLAQLALVEARLSFKSGNQAQGFAQAMEVVRFGQRIEEADGGHLHYLVGSAVKGIALNYVRHFAAESTLPASNLVRISGELTNYAASQAALRQSLRVEFYSSGNFFDSMSTNPVAYFGYFYNADRTKRDLANQMWRVMGALTNCYAAGVVLLPVVQTNPSYVKLLLHGNLVGTLLNDMDAQGRGSLLAGKCRENVSVRAARLALALRAFQMENHRPAGSLAELVPQFIEAVPLDDYDGNPLRYSSSLDEIYSVGRGLVDLGGVAPTNASGNLLFPLYSSQP